MKEDFDFLDENQGQQLFPEELKFESIQSVTKKERKKQIKSRSLTQQQWEQIVKGASNDEDSLEKIKVGICAMNKKVECIPMQEIIVRLLELAKTEIKVIIFKEEMFMCRKIFDWPKVDVLIAFYSQGFPLTKVQEYCAYQKPFLINDVMKQDILLDRSLVYQELSQIQVATPKHYFVIRNKNESILKQRFEDETEMLKQKEEQFYKLNNNKKSFHQNMSSYESSVYQQQGENEDDTEDCLNFLQESIKEEGKFGTENLEKKNKAQSKQSSTVIYDDDTKSMLKKFQIESAKESQSKQKKLADEKIAKIDDKISKAEQNKSKEDKIIIQENSDEEYELDCEEHQNYIIINGEKFFKPFVEKPIDAENHNIYIYYAMDDGGGCKKLFRKINNISSMFDKSQSEIRQEGNFIYEEFLQTDGFDIKVYTVGPNYAHAEARKSPTLDGVVQRTANGKEVRYPVTLTPEEKLIARKIVLWFGQNVCGFDLLRGKGKSYVCDINGWSFVKGNATYYNDCALLLYQMILAKFFPGRINKQIIMTNKTQIEEVKMSHIFRPQNMKQQDQVQEELRSIVVIFRHGDRTPKQKMKMIVTDRRFLKFFQGKRKDVKLKESKSLIKVLEIANKILDEVKPEDYEGEQNSEINKPQLYEYFTKLMQLKSVLEKDGNFQEIGRKIQLKPLTVEKIVCEKGNEKVFIKKALFVLKWGGELTHSGSNFNQKFQQASLKQLILEKILDRHDLKIYSSDEGRCQKTAAAFAKGFLGLEGALTPILVSLVRKDAYIQELLDLNDQEDLKEEIKNQEHLSELLNMHGNFYENFKKITQLNDCEIETVQKDILLKIGDSYNLLEEILNYIRRLTKIIRQNLSLTNKTYYIKPGEFQNQQKVNQLGCGKENLLLVFKRWRKLEIDFYNRKKDLFNISKLPDILDSVTYDLIHNSKYFRQKQFGKLVDNLFISARQICEFVIASEYGMTIKNKLFIGLKVVAPLLKKIKGDLLWWNTNSDLHTQEQIEESQFYTMKAKESYQSSNFQVNQALVKSEWRHIRTRLYFSSASHLNSLFNVIKYGLNGKLVQKNLQQINDHCKILNYFSHISFKLFENFNAKHEHENYRMEICLCPGCSVQPNQEYSDHTVPIIPSIQINQNLTLDEFENFFSQMLGAN